MDELCKEKQRLYDVWFKRNEEIKLELHNLQVKLAEGRRTNDDLIKEQTKLIEKYTKDSAERHCLLREREQELEMINRRNL